MSPSPKNHPPPHPTFEGSTFPSENKSHPPTSVTLASPSFVIAITHQLQCPIQIGCNLNLIWFGLNLYNFFRFQYQSTSFFLKFCSLLRCAYANIVKQVTPLLSYPPYRSILGAPITTRHLFCIQAHLLNINTFHRFPSSPHCLHVNCQLSSFSDDNKKQDRQRKV